jgi:hypothetical protein
LTTISLGFQSKQNALELKTNEIEKYFSFARMYGYIKYLYPGDEAAAIDWDKFAYYVASYLSDSSSGIFKDDMESLFTIFIFNLNKWLYIRSSVLLVDF